MSTPSTLIDQIQRQAGMIVQTDREEVPIVLMDGPALPFDRLTVYLITRTHTTIGAIAVPSQWAPPPSCGTRLAVPPDQKGWNTIEKLCDLGFREVIITTE